MEPIKLAPDTTYPLILFLHGRGERGTDNRQHLVHGGDLFASPAFRTRHPVFVVVPQCPAGKEPTTSAERVWTSRLEPGAPARVDLDSAQTPQLDAALALVDKFIETRPVDRKRVYVVGLSMGGYAAWELAARHPQRFAAIIPICGAGDARHAHRLKRTPIWAFHGTNDEIISITHSHDMVNAVNTAGGRAILTAYAHTGHDSWTRTFETMQVWDWLFAQRLE
jgi:predicted peptidase